MACKAIFDFSPRIPRAYRSSVPLIGKTTSDTFRRRYQQDENLECLSNNSRETPHL